jgi:hypothetical protein
MSKASELMHISANANDAIERAESAGADITQDWEHEATLYAFDDDSVLVLSGPQLNAYADLESAREAIKGDAS